MSSCLSTLFSTIPTSIIPSFPSPTPSLVVAEIVVGFISVSVIIFRIIRSAPVEFDMYMAWLRAVSDNSEKSSVLIFFL